MTLVAHPPSPAPHFWDWQQHGACRSLPPEMFFHPERERGSARRQRIEQAKEVCATCPVLQACRDHALRIREPYGVWGGLDEDERQRLFARRDLGVA